MCVVEAKGSTGGICVMWKSGLMCQQVEYNKNLTIKTLLRSRSLIPFAAGSL